MDIAFWLERASSRGIRLSDFVSHRVVWPCKPGVVGSVAASNDGEHGALEDFGTPRKRALECARRSARSAGSWGSKPGSKRG